MQSLRQTNKSQWQTYKQLELIPDSVPAPNTNASTFKFGLGFTWRKLLSLLMDELVDEQKVDYLERCWVLNEFGQKDESSSSSLQRLWLIMN